MAKEYEIKIPAHKSIYSSNPKERELNVYFCEPENGVNDETGIILLIAGFGAHAKSNVYKKMRREFADNYNLITVQCDYFGYEFMQEPLNANITVDINNFKQILNENDFKRVFENGVINMTEFLKISGKYDYTFRLEGEADLSEENSDNFNEMGIMQAIDNIYAVLNVVNILLDNNLPFNSKKIIMYGHSHGAYLAYFCNLLAPSLFSLIIDNSAWIYPYYIDNKRLLTKYITTKTCILFHFDYYAKRNTIDREIYDLIMHYKKLDNNCRIISLHGTEDILVSYKQKDEFCTGVEKCKIIKISEEKVDGEIFKSCEHGLDADFLKLFDYVMNDLGIDFKKDMEINLIDKVYLETSRYTYEINYENVIPNIQIAENL